MEMHPVCVSCVLCQVERLCGHLKLPPEKAMEIWRSVLRSAGRYVLQGKTAPEFAEVVYNAAARVIGAEDPYRELKKEHTRKILDELNYFHRAIDAASDRLRAATIFALLGNVIDYGISTMLREEEVFRNPEQVDVALDEYDRFRKSVESAKKILYIGDNAGEAVLDRLLLEEIRRVNPDTELFFAVRHKPAINDALAEDAVDAGIDRVASIISSGSPLAGTLLKRTSLRFQNLFRQADMVIAKGQGNFETMEQEEREIFLLLRVKCTAISRFTRLPVGSLILARNIRFRNRVSIKEKS